jgi:hypothetical protein
LKQNGKLSKKYLSVGLFVATTVEESNLERIFNFLSSLKLFQLDIESMSRYASPINPAIYPHLALVLLGIGLFFTAW